MRWRPEFLAIAWLAVVLAMGAHALWWWQTGAPLDTSILAMLPRDAGSAWEERAREQVVQRGERQLLVLVGHPRAQEAAHAADAAAHALRGAPLDCSAAEGGPQALDFLSRHHQRLLDPATREALQSLTPVALAQDALRRLYSPLPDVAGIGVAADPFALHGRWLQAQAARSRLQPSAGRLVAEAEGRHWVALSCSTDGSPFDEAVQQRVTAALAAARRAAQGVGGTEVIAAGVVLHAAAAARSARAEVATIGTGGMAGIAVLLFAVFGSLRPVFVLQLPVLVGALAGLSACLLAFGRVHALTVVFGASLLGVAVDYPIHYASHVSSGAPLAERLRTLRELLPGLTIAMLTTVAAYLALAIPPFPGLRQMALFAGAGLAAAWATVVCWCPWLVVHGVRREAPAVRALLAVQRRVAAWPSRLRWAALACLVLAALPLLPGVRVNDDLRMLQGSPPELLAEQARVAGIAGLASPAQYFLVTGPDAETVLEREQVLGRTLHAAVADGRLRGHVALSQWVPSLRRQAEDLALQQARIYAEGGALELLAGAADFDAAWVEAARVRFATARATPLMLDDWLAQPGAAEQRAQWLGCAYGGCASVVLLDGVAGTAGLQEMAALADPDEGVYWVDTVSRTSALLARYRAGMTEVLGLAVAFTLALLWVRHRRNALRAIVPPLCAAVLTLALFAGCGVELNLFVVLAFVMVLGMGVDYGIYLAEPIDQELSGVGLALDVLTTILGFGLLALSSTPALHLFGVTLAVAVTVAWLAAGLAGLRAPAPSSTDPATRSPA